MNVIRPEQNPQVEKYQKQQREEDQLNKDHPLKHQFDLSVFLLLVELNQRVTKHKLNPVDKVESKVVDDEVPNGESYSIEGVEVVNEQDIE